MIRKALAGDERAGDWIAREHYPKIIRFLRHLTGNLSDAEDLTQNTFIRANSALAEFRHDSSLSTWLHRIAYREYCHYLRDRREYVEPFPEMTHEFRQRSEDAVVLAAAIQNLPSDLREAFVLQEIQRLSVREAATVLGVPEGTVKSRNHLARTRLRTALEGVWGHPNSAESLETKNESI